MRNKVFEAYIVNLGKYNEGQTEGRWVQFPCTKEALHEALKKIGIGAEYEESFISEYDSDRFFGLDHVLGKYENIENLNYLAKRLQEFSETETEKFNVIMDNEIAMPEGAGAVDCINLTYNLNNYSWYPEVRKEYDLGYHYVHNRNSFDIEGMGEFSAYFDYEAYGRDISTVEGGYFTRQGYIGPPEDSQDIYNGNTMDIPAEYRMKSENILFSVIQHGFESHFRMEEQSLDALMQQFKSKEHPFAEMEGEEIDAVTFAGLSQSDEITLSVTADIDNDRLEVYEINGVPEGERTDDNSNIWERGLKEYIKGLEEEADSVQDKDSIIQATEEYMEQLTVTEEAMVMEG